MNYKLFNLLIFVTAWGLTTPTPAVYGRGLEPQQEIHLVCHKQAQQWLCDDDRSNQESAEDEGAVRQAQATANGKAPAGAAKQGLNPAQQRSISNTLIWLSYLVPCGLGLGLFMYHRYSVYRDVVLQKQIETLERLWQHGLDNDATSDTGRGTGS